MRKFILIIVSIAATLPFIFRNGKVVEIRLAGSGPDVTYRVLVEGKERAKIKRGENVKLRLKSGERAIEVAVGDIVIDSIRSNSRIVLFSLPSLQNPIVDYTFSGSSLVVKRVYDNGPYPVEWRVNGKNNFPLTFTLPAAPTLEGYIQGKRVFSERLSLSRISHTDLSYDGNHLRVYPKLSGFFKPQFYDVNGLKLASPLSVKALTLPRKITVRPVYGSVEWDGMVLKIPEIPELSVKNFSVTLNGKGFLLDGSSASGTIELSDGTNTVEWSYTSGDMSFKRIWRFYVDRVPPKVDVNWKVVEGSMILDVRSNEWSKFKVKSGPIILTDEGTEVSFRIKKILSGKVIVYAVDRGGNETVREINLGEVKR